MSEQLTAAVKAAEELNETIRGYNSVIRSELNAKAAEVDSSLSESRQFFDEARSEFRALQHLHSASTYTYRSAGGTAYAPYWVQLTPSTIEKNGRALMRVQCWGDWNYSGTHASAVLTWSSFNSVRVSARIDHMAGGDTLHFALSGAGDIYIRQTALWGRGIDVWVEDSDVVWTKETLRHDEVGIADAQSVVVGGSAEFRKEIGEV